MTTEEWNQYFTGHWNFSGERQDKHLAMFPEELPRRLIKMFSFVSDTVLDPFLGSGTTCLAARNLGRNSIGYEINEEFLPVIRKKLDINQPTILEDCRFDIIKQKMTPHDFTADIETLPYVFEDPVKFDKKIDPKKLRFGSKIDDGDHKREEYFTVKRVLSPTTVMLNTGLKVRLLGICEYPETSEEAISFLHEKTKGQKVFMKFDQWKYDNDQTLLCYLYLQNKTFLNRHLVKRGLVDVETSVDYKYREKFLSERSLPRCKKTGLQEKMAGI